MKLLIGFIALVSIWIGLIVSIFFDDLSTFKLPEIRIFPRFRIKYQNLENEYEDPYIIEHLHQKQKEKTNMKSGLYLTHHRYLLESFVSKDIDLFERKFSLNDICYKPHENIIYSDDIKNKPEYFERLELEAQRLSPCLIVSPINCFYDSYMLYSKINKWKHDVDSLNRRLRDSYLDYIGENETKPYINEDDGLLLIQKWGKLMSQLAQKIIGEKNSKLWYERVEKWINSLQPTSKICADPTRTCEQYPDERSYFNLCKDMNKINKTIGKMNIVYQLDEQDIKMLTEIDCVDDRKKFIEWEKQKDIESIMNNLSLSNKSTPNYDQILSRGCPGIFNKMIPLFDRGFEKFGEQMNTEFYLMTPEELKNQLNRKALINKVENVWTTEDAQDIIREWRKMIREEVEKNNNLKGSIQIGVNSEIGYDPDIDFNKNNNEIEKYVDAIQLILFFTVVSLALFTTFIWINYRIYSISMFFGRLLLTSLVFVNCFVDNQGFLTIHTRYTGHIVILLIINLYVSTRIYNLKNVTKKKRNIDRNGNIEHGSESNLSWISRGVATNEANRWTLSRIWIVLDLYVRRQRIKKMKDEKKTSIKFWDGHSWTLLIVLAGIAQYFENDHIIEIFSILIPILIWYFIEKKWILYQLQKKMGHLQKRRETIVEMVENVRELMVEKAVCEEEEEKKTSNKRIEKEMRKIETVQYLQTSIERLELIDGYIETRNPGFIVRISNLMKMYIITGYLNILKQKRKVSLGCLALSALIFIISLVLLWNVTINETSEQLRSLENNELWIDIELKNYTTHWKERKNELKQFMDQIDNIDGLIIVTDWLKLSEKSSNSVDFHTNVIEWYLKDNVIASIVAPLMKPSWIFGEWKLKQFKFSVRCDVEENKLDIQKLVEIVKVWNKRKEMMDISVRYWTTTLNKWSWLPKQELFISLICTLLLFIELRSSSCSTYFQLFLAVFAILATNIEASIIGWITSTDIQIMSKIGLLIGILSTWPPFKQLVSYQRRHNRMIFDEAMTTFQFFFLLSMSTVAVLTVSIGICPNNTITIIAFLLVILIGTMNSLAITMGTLQLFDKKRKLAIFNDVNCSKTIQSLRNMFIDKDFHSIPRSISISSEECENDVDSKHEICDEELEEEEDVLIDEQEKEKEVLEAIGELKQRLETPLEDEEEERLEREEFLRNVKNSNVTLRTMIGDSVNRQQRQHMFLDIVRDFDSRHPYGSQPSTSTYKPPPPPEEPEEPEEPHPHARYFPADFTRDMIEFIIDPVNRNGIPWYPPTEEELERMREPTVEEQDAESRRRIRQLVQDEDRERRIMEIVENNERSEDEGIGDDAAATDNDNDRD